MWGQSSGSVEDVVRQYTKAVGLESFHPTGVVIWIVRRERKSKRRRSRSHKSIDRSGGKNSGNAAAKSSRRAKKSSSFINNEMFSEPKSGLTHGKSTLVSMGKCVKSGSKSATSILFALLLGAVIGGLFGLLDTAVKYVLISGEQENMSQQMRRSALEGSFVGAVFGSLFAGLKLMM